MSADDASPPPVAPLSPSDLAVLKVLVAHANKVVSRESLSRLAGLEADSARRADSCLVAVRRVLGHDSVQLVRRRGWMLSADGLIAAQQLLRQIEQTG